MNTNNLRNSSSKNCSNNSYCRSSYTLGGSQPYVLTSQWPRAFTKPQTKWVPDYSMAYVNGYNFDTNYHPVNHSSNLCSIKHNMKPMVLYPYEGVNK